MALKNSLIRKHSLLWVLLLCSGWALAQSEYTPSPENLKTRAWFSDAAFGLFVHWGTYSVLGNGEWVQQVTKIDKQTYQELPGAFYPHAYNPTDWVRMAKNAGMEYIVITSKHHDGFAMWDSKVSDWDIVDRTPYKKDVLKALSDACQKEGMKLFFYYSQLDWYQDNYFPRGETGQYTKRPNEGDWYKYLDFMDAQLTELLTGYGPIAGIWFDGWWDKKKADWRLKQTYDLIHRLQPACMVGSNHHQTPFPGEDFQMFEKDLPGHNTTGFSGEATIGNLPLESCETMNNSWGYNLYDHSYKSGRDLIRYLVKASGYNANFLLNVGPMPTGEIQQAFRDTLSVVGTWLRKNGKSIYGTRGGPLTPRSWGVTTQKGNTVYVHVLNLEDKALLLPSWGKKIKSVVAFETQQPLKFQSTDAGWVIQLPANAKADIDLILEIQVE